MTWIGRLSAIVRNSPSAVMTQQEKSCAVFMTPARPVRNRVFAICLTIPLNRALEHGELHAVQFRRHALSSFVAPRGDQQAAARRALDDCAPGSTTTVVTGDSTITGPGTCSPPGSDSK